MAKPLIKKYTHGCLLLPDKLFANTVPDRRIDHPPSSIKTPELIFAYTSGGGNLR